MFRFAEVPWEKIIDNKLMLKRLNPNSRLLSHVSICGLGVNDESIIAYFNFHENPELEKNFSEDVGLVLNDRTQGWEMLQVYNRALSKEISRYLPCCLESKSL
jgi:hypothetical protein